MGKICHTIVNDVGDDNVFLKEIEKKDIENNEEMCPHGAYTCQGPQGSINVHVALVCLNIGSEPQTLHTYACICICKACDKCLLVKLEVMKVIEIDLIVV